MIGRRKKYTTKFVTILKDDGPVQLGIIMLQKLQRHHFHSLVDRESVMAANWSDNPYRPSKKKSKQPYTVNWVMSPPAGGGGHQNIFRFIEHLDSLGHKNNIYLYSRNDLMTPEQASINVSAYCKAKNLSFQRYDDKGQMAQADVLFATGWETAYPVFNEKTDARKMYFVQDFEPFFYPMGTDYVLAENTYKFGFHGITAGGYLKHKLSSEYGMTCDSYDFAADEKTYKHTNKGERKEIFFYARPVTERRGFDLGIMVLELFHRARPDYTINLAGWDVSGYDIPFPYVNHKALKIEDLPDLYNQCAAALVISLTNMSLLPPELLACGVIPVVNDGPNNRLVSNNKHISYVDASPAKMAAELVNIVDDKQLKKRSLNASKSIHGSGWAASKDTFMRVLERELSS